MGAEGWRWEVEGGREKGGEGKGGRERKGEKGSE